MARGRDIVDEAIRPITFVQTGRVRDITFEAGMTIAQALRAVSVRVTKSHEIRLNNQPVVDHDTTLSPGDQIMLIGNVSGGL